jgi:hypothetical protein
MAGWIAKLALLECRRLGAKRSDFRPTGKSQSVIQSIKQASKQSINQLI